MSFFFFFSSRRRHTRSLCDWSSDVCSSDLRRWLPRGERRGDPRDLRRLEGRQARGRPPQRRRRDRGRRPRGGPRRGIRDCTEGARLGSGGRAARPARRLLAGEGGGRLMGRFRDALAQPGLGAIAEVKRRSPSAGDLRPDADPAELTAAFEGAGASAVSVLVDERFAGTWDDLRAARAKASLPLLAKGFFSTREHLETARSSGADAVLLLLRDLDDAVLRELLGVAAELGLNTLVEAHDSEELARATALEAPVIGLNARDLATFEIDRRAQLGLVAAAPRSCARTTRPRRWPTC